MSAGDLRLVLSQLPRRREVVNNLTRYVVALGGMGVIAAIALIFVYLLWVVAPIFAPAGIDDPYLVGPTNTDSLLVDVSESGEHGFVVGQSGAVDFFEVHSGVDTRASVTEDLDAEVAAVQRIYPNGSGYVARTTSDELKFFDVSYPVSFEDDERFVDPTLEILFEEETVELAGDGRFDVFLGEDTLVIAELVEQELVIYQFRDVDPEFALESPRRSTLALDAQYDQLLFGPRGQWLYLLDGAGRVEIIDVARPRRAQRVGLENLIPAGRSMTAFAPLLGRYSLLVGDDQGTVAQWVLTRTGTGVVLNRVRDFAIEGVPTKIVPEPRRKGFATISDSNLLQLFYTTTERELADYQLAESVRVAAISPRSRAALLVGDSGAPSLLPIANEHPDISWSAMWQKVWYEGYPEPVYSWQSSSADNDFEPKFSLAPRLYGTLKAAFYAMLFATPLAIMGAVYTAYFMASGMRRIVKPGIEIMAALPTVILGFLAGLWLAPLIEANLSSILSILVVLPLGLLLLSWLWGLLPERFAKGSSAWYGLIVVGPIILLTALSFWIGPVVESLLFGGNAKAWFLEVAGLQYDQRNALVVGLAMGLAVIPTIFSIAEDAIYGVPTHLKNGSLALGATPWQTLTRVVLLTASPGIFSAVMIGLGRAVGETMIVLMATGNTPVMDMNVFEGMRTFAANIAVELPESEVGSSHYRILFLAALVLFMLTFVFNTAAELVRQRLRARYGSL